MYSIILMQVFWYLQTWQNLIPTKPGPSVIVKLFPNFLIGKYFSSTEADKTELSSKHRQ